MKLTNLLLSLAYDLLIIVSAFAEMQSRTAPIGYIPIKVEQTATLNKPMISDSHILLIQDVYPWGVQANEIVLQEKEITYHTISTKQLAEYDIVPYGAIIVASDQLTSSYINLEKNRHKLASYVYSGGILVAHACEWGWNGGSWTGSWLPGGEEHVEEYSNTLEISKTDHPLLTGLSNKNLDNWAYSAHGYFTGGIGSVIIASDGKPTYIEYFFGEGRVLATTQPLEWPLAGYYGTLQLLRNEVNYLLQLLAVNPITVRFDSDKNCGLAPLSVSFWDESFEKPANWDWNIAVDYSDNGGIHVKDSSFTYEYWYSGDNDVRLVARNEKGNNDILRWQDNRSFISVYGPCGFAALQLIEHSPDSGVEPWENIIDGDIWGNSGTATIANIVPASAVFSFKDGRIKKLTKIRLLTNTGIGMKERWVHNFHVDVSTDGLNWSTAVTGNHLGDFEISPGILDLYGGWWQDFNVEPAVMASFVRLIVDDQPKPWVQIGEFEVYEDIQLPDPSQSRIETTSPHLADGIDASLITLYLKDSNGMPVTGYDAHDIVFTCRGDFAAATLFKPFLEIQPGVYQTTLTSPNAGDFHVVAASHGAVVGNSRESGYSNTVTFMKGVYKFPLKIVEASASHLGESWDHSIDGILDGWEGTATVEGNPPYVIFAFADDKTYPINKFGIQTDNGTDDDLFTQRQPRLARIDISTTGTAAADFSRLCGIAIKQGKMEYYHITKPAHAKYIKFSLLIPNSGWRQIVEFEVHLDAKLDEKLNKDVSSSVPTPEFYNLSQNYPNPFNPQTNLRFDLPEEIKTTLIVYNTMGQIVTILIDGIVKAGQHDVKWDASSVPSGIYLCQMTAGGYKKVVRMLLLK